MGYTDLHTHTTFCDGKCTPEEMVTAAIDKGITTLGLLAHSYVDFDRDYSIRPERVCEFRAEVKRLKEKYKGRIELLLGIEADYYATELYGDTDYVIGSVHYLSFDDGYHSIDISEDEQRRIVDEKFGGDWYAMCEAYYELVSRVRERCSADIVGHFDIITKFNEGDRLFNTDCERYRAAWRGAADKLIANGVCFEINTGAMSRKKRTSPYPAADILEYLKSRGARFVLSSDAHRAEHLAYRFDEYSGYLS